MLRFLVACSLSLLPTTALAQAVLETSPAPRVTHLELAELGHASAGLQLAPGQRWTVDIASPFAARSAGLWWHGSFADAELTLMAADGSSLASWPLFADEDQAPAMLPVATVAARPAGSRQVSGLVHSLESAFTSMRLTVTGPARVADLALVLVEDFAAPERPLDPTAALGTPGTAPGGQLGLTAGFPKPSVYSRASWGADAPQCGLSYCTTTHMAVHHTASSADFAASTWSQAASNVKSVQAYHMYTNGWCDIGYNYLITKQGWIFEGRAGGDNVKGAHDGFNCGSMGVAAMGYFHTPVHNQPTAALLDAFEELGAWKCDQQGIDPKASSWYAGYGAVMNNVYGHKNVKSTACPGDHLYAKLPELRNGIAALLAGGGPTNGTLKGVLYNANLGTGAPLVGTVALANGSFVKTGTNGYFEFALAAGSYQFAGTAPGFTIKAASETVTSGDVWESLGLSPNSSVPAHVNTSLSSSLFNATFAGDVGSPVFLGYSGAPGLPLQTFAGIGLAWVDLGALQTLYLGTVPSNGVLSVNLSVSGAPIGLILHTQGYVLKGGVARLTNGAAWKSQ